MQTRIFRTSSTNKDFINLVKELDAYLKTTDGEEHDFYNQFNNIDMLKHVVLIFVDEKPVACGAMKPFDFETMEIKRMYVSPKNRGVGLAQKVLHELEVWAKELTYKKCILETGKRQVEAVKFYHKCKYSLIPNYGQYIGMENSFCFKKMV